MNEVWETIKDGIKYRTNSTLYGTFFVSWLITNRKVWFIMFFVSEESVLERYNMLKLDYLSIQYPFDSFWVGLRSICELIVIPSVAVFSIHWVLCKVERVVFKKGIENSHEKEEIKIRADKKLQELLLENEEVKEQVIEKKVKNEESEQMKNEQLREKEYLSLKNDDRLKSALEQAQNSIYRYSGRTYQGSHIVGASEKAFLDLKGLCILGKEDRGAEIISITKKGRYFMNRYMQDHSK